SDINAGNANSGSGLSIRADGIFCGSYSPRLICFCTTKKNIASAAKKISGINSFRRCINTTQLCATRLSEESAVEIGTVFFCAERYRLSAAASAPPQAIKMAPSQIQRTNGLK